MSLSESPQEVAWEVYKPRVGILFAERPTDSNREYAGLNWES